MKIIYLLGLLISVQLLSGCCTSKVSSDQKLPDTIQNQNDPAAVVQNLSIVKARVDKVLYKDETDYQLLVTLMTVEETSSKPSIAVAGNTYTLKPNFRYDDGKISENIINKSLKSLGKISEGTEFKAEISLEKDKNWYIQKVLDK